MLYLEPFKKTANKEKLIYNLNLEQIDALLIDILIADNRRLL
jgi:hypothetical protein